MSLLYHPAMSDARLEQFKQMVAEFPEAPMAHFSLGKAYLERRQYAEAVKALESAVRLDSQYAAAMVSLGRCLYRGRGDAEGARGAWPRP
jgi:cytochrome c-type biogenesis protein CcmH/NrfG